MSQAATFVDHPSGFLALSPRNTLFVRPGRAGFVAYRRQGRYRLNLGGVQAPAGEREALLDAFLAESRSARDRVVAVQVRRDQVELFRSRGFTVNQLGSSFGLDLGRFGLSGGSRLKLRNRIAHARRAGVHVYELGRDRPLTADAWAALHALSRAWLAGKGAHELDFLVGELGSPGDTNRRVFVAETEGARLVGFITYVPAWGTHSGYLHDLTRRLPDAPAGVMELINATALERFAAEGHGFLHFGLTPFIVDPVEPAGGGRMLARVLRFLGRLRFVYPTQSQVDYKLKWAPDLVERESIAFERVTFGALWALLVATGALRWPRRSSSTLSSSTPPPYPSPTYGGRGAPGFTVGSSTRCYPSPPYGESGAQGFTVGSSTPLPGEESSSS
jgi:lysylphosphatidylglycerol synthetase-like protein (DUF2156 family)